MASIFDSYLRAKNASFNQGANALAMQGQIEAMKRDRGLRNALAQAYTPAMPETEAMGPTRPGESLPNYPGQAERLNMAPLFEQGFGPEALKIRQGMQTRTGGGIGTYNPRDYTAESWGKFVTTRDPSVLERYESGRVQDVGDVPYIFDPATKSIIPISRGGRDLTPEDVARNVNVVNLGKRAATEGKSLTPSGEMKVVPGSEAAEQAETKKRSGAKLAGFISRDIRMAEDFLDKSADNPYVRTAKSKFFGTDEYEFQQQIKSLQATIGIDSLLDIKREGAGLGQVPQTQLDLLSRLLGQLDIARDKDVQKQLLSDIKQNYGEIIERMTPEERKKYGVAGREAGLYEAAKEPTDSAERQLPPVNDRGWQLMEDAQGNKAYVGPNGEVEEL